MRNLGSNLMRRWYILGGGNRSVIYSLCCLIHETWNYTTRGCSELSKTFLILVFWQAKCLFWTRTSHLFVIISYNQEHHAQCHSDVNRLIFPRKRILGSQIVWRAQQIWFASGFRTITMSLAFKPDVLLIEKQRPSSWES